ncbi:hypothetical protein PULV_a6003 [Pseudoalteromonas ulvae UL12]|nr:hypothetical protein [Pseudoalteromonas ulvae UL12]
MNCNKQKMSLFIVIDQIYPLIIPFLRAISLNFNLYHRVHPAELG